jgi:DNA-binding MarR family transcriptional regulator
MSNDLTPSETRFVQALCGAGPLGIPPLGLARALGVTPATVGNLSTIVERKGFCTRERYGMRIFLRPTSTALALVASLATAADTPLPIASASSETKKTRAPRAPRMR